MTNISICLSDLPESKITTGKNGKKYINLTVDNRREPDQYGNTHTVYVSQTKEERQAKQQKTYVGNGKEFTFQKNTEAPTQPASFYNPHPNADDLPF